MRFPDDIKIENAGFGTTASTGLTKIETTKHMESIIEQLGMGDDDDCGLGQKL